MQVGLRLGKRVPASGNLCCKVEDSLMHMKPSAVDRGAVLISIISQGMNHNLIGIWEKP